MREIFLSYGRADDESFARRLCKKAEAEGFDVWYDRDCMPNRRLSLTQEIRDEIDQCERLLLVAGLRCCRHTCRPMEACLAVWPVRGDYASSCLNGRLAGKAAGAGRSEMLGSSTVR